MKLILKVSREILVRLKRRWRVKDMVMSGSLWLLEDGGKEFGSESQTSVV